MKNLSNDKNNALKKEFTKVETKAYDFENQYIILAIESENQKLYVDAIKFYLILFKNTNNYEYLVRYLRLSIGIGDYESVEKNAKEYLIENIKEEEVILRLYIYALFKLNKNEEALVNAERLITNYKNSVNYQLLGSIYLENKNYLKAYELFELSYELEDSNSTLLAITNIQYNNLLKKEKAIKRLENNIKKSEYNYNIAIQLLSFYEKEKHKNKIITLLKDMYYHYKENGNQFLLNKTKILFIKFVSIDDVSIAINFLEENNEEDEHLLNLYRVTNNTKKAKILLNKLYKETNNVEYLAQIAIITFETANNKKTILDEVILKFEKVLETSTNHIYQNYLAYLLIDFDIDIEKGIKLVKKALLKDANNFAYIDTLAWGEYKMNNCDEAYIQMKKVVDEIGLDEEEIKLHWEKIKECKK